MGVVESARLANPFLLGNGAGGPHNDSHSTNRSPYEGPGAGPVNSHLVLLGACPTLLINGHGFPVGNFVEGVSGGKTLLLQRSLRVLDPTDLTVLATLPVTPIGVDGMYNYIDDQDRIVLGDGSGHVVRVAQTRDDAGHWTLAVVDDWDVTGHIFQHCGGDPSCEDYIASVKPDWQGRIWFSTTGGVLGTIDPDTGHDASVRLPDGEQVIKAISSSVMGVAVVSDHALYLFRADVDGTPRQLWREAYDRGSAQKPGQRNQGCGTSPTFFGDDGSNYVAIMDNADGCGNLLVFRTADHAEDRLVCRIPLFLETGTSGTDDTFIVAGPRSLIATNTFGYNYYDYSNTLVGGLTRVDVRDDESGADVVWTNPAATTTVPKLAAGSGLIHLIDRSVASDGSATYAHLAIDAETGKTAGASRLGTDVRYEGIQSCGAFGPDGSYYQGTIAGVVRTSAAMDQA